MGTRISFSVWPESFGADDADVRIVANGWPELEEVQPSDLLVVPTHAVGGPAAQRVWRTSRLLASPDRDPDRPDSRRDMTASARARLRR